jgi:hypothetical protein
MPPALYRGFPCVPSSQGDFAASVLPATFGLTVYASTCVWELRCAIAARSGIPPARVGLHRVGPWAGSGGRSELLDSDNGKALSELGLLKAQGTAAAAKQALAVSLRQGATGRTLPLLVDPAQVCERGRHRMRKPQFARAYLCAP